MMSTSCLTASSLFHAVLKTPSPRRVCGGKLSPGLVVRCEKASQAEVNSRRAVLTGLGAAALVINVQPSSAAYGEGAKIFGGKASNQTGFIPYEGDGFAILLPSKWNPSAKREYQNVALRYEDNYYPVNSLTVIKRPSDKAKISDYGPPDKFLQDNSTLFGQSVYTQAAQEGGFKKDTVSAANILDTELAKDSSGKEYYKYHTITRTADGTEGGTHQLIAATVDKDKNLYILRVNMGDKRWYTGSKKYAEGAWNSFVVA